MTDNEVDQIYRNGSEIAKQIMIRFVEDMNLNTAEIGAVLLTMTGIFHQALLESDQAPAAASFLKVLAMTGRGP